MTFAVGMAVAVGGCGRNPDPYRQQGLGAMEAHEYSKAVDAYATAVEIKPGDAPTRNALGRALLAANRPADAVEHLKIASEQEPENEKYLADYCNGLLQAGRAEEMFRLLRGNTESRGLWIDYLRLGRFAMQAGDPDTAKTAMLTAARLDRGRSLEPQLALCDLYTKVGDKVNAVRRVRMAYYLDPREGDVLNRAKALGETPGPTFGLQPVEQNELPATPKP